MKTKTIGQSLKDERQNRRISLERMAEVTHIRLDYLEALENDQFDVLPSAAYVRGFIKAYTQYVAIESKPYLALLRRDYKETKKGQLVPRDFVKPMRLRRARWTPFTWVTIALAIFFGVIVTYLAIQLYRVSRPPELVITSPESRQTVAAETPVSGFTDPDAIITINDQPVAIQPDGSFQTTLRFPVEGVGIISVVATDRSGKSTKQMVTVTVQY